MDKELITMASALACCLFGSGGIVLWMLNRASRKLDEKDDARRDIKEIKETLKEMERGLVMALENDKVIFSALRSHEINGESEEQERKMDDYFLSLL